MRRRLTTLLLALGALGSAAVLAGCGVDRTIDPVAAAATKTQNAGGAKLAMTVGVTADGTSFDVKADGVFDRNEGDLTMDLSDALAAAGQPGSGKVELRYRQESGDPVLYLNMPALTSRLPGSPTWVRLDLEQAGSALGVDLNQLLTQGGQNPSDVLDLLRASGSVTQVGTETVNGEPTTHYRASIELAKATDDLGESARAMVQRLIDSGAPAAIPVDVWVGDDGFVRKLTLDETVSMQGHTGEVKLDLELSDYGTTVDVAAPPSGETLDLSGLLARVGAGAVSTH